MLQILNPQGVDLTENPPGLSSVTVPNLTATSNVRVEVLLVNNDSTLAFDLVNGTVNWNDGSQPVVYTGTGTLSLDVTRALPPGNYIINVVASDFGLPPEVLSLNMPVQVSVANGVAQSTPIVYGPVLPKDVGYPNPDQWNFNRGTDLDIITSSIKMLLTTNKGERLMLPEYGTNLRVLLFEFNSPGLVSMCQQEIVDALTKWEPRASLNFLTIESTGPRAMTINAVFTSKLNQQQITLSLPFAA